MNRFYLHKLVLTGPGHQDSVIEFKHGLNIITGPSNTGKSLIMDCIDYVFGFTPKPDKPSKIVDNPHGYKNVILHLATDGGTLVLNREIGSTKIFVSGTDTTVDHGLYSVSHSAQKSINTVYLHLLGIDDAHKILSSEGGNTQSLTWRSVMHLFFMRQSDVARETSALKAPGSMGKTASPAALLYLLTGHDADNLEKPIPPEISKAKRKALTEYIRDKQERLTKRREEIEAELADVGIEDIQEEIDLIYADIDSLQTELNDALSKSKDLMFSIYSQNSKLSECNTVSHNFTVLKKQYRSDIKRINFIIDGSFEMAGTQTIKHCPLCNNEIEKMPTEQIVSASSYEIDKLKDHLIELDRAQSDVEKQKATLIQSVTELEQKKASIDATISGELRPRIAMFKQELDQKMALVRLAGELETVKQNEIQYKSELFEKETEEDPQNPTYNIYGQYDYDLIHGFEEKLVEILSSSKIGGATTARLNMTNFDIEIGGFKKAVAYGGGYCGILNTITAMAMSAYIISKDGKAPAFFASDSSLTQLSEADHVADKDTVKNNFIQYLVNHALERQIIFVEQKKRMPFIPAEDNQKGIHVIEFSRNKSSGRYGFLNDVYNPEDI